MVTPSTTFMAQPQPDQSCSLLCPQRGGGAFTYPHGWRYLPREPYDLLVAAFMLERGRPVVPEGDRR